MQPAVRPTDTVLREPKEASLEFAERPEFEPTFYARDLRAVGQGLEARHIAVLDLVVVANTYVIRGRVRTPRNGYFSAPVRFGSLMRSFWSMINGELQPRLTDQTLDLRYGLDDISRFDQMGRSKRRNPNEVPNPHSLSQILRGAGSYLDSKKGSSLIGISVEGRWVTIHYETANGHPAQTRQDVEYYYDYWVKMYLRRSNRTQLPLLSDPTIIVTWEGIKTRLG